MYLNPSLAKSGNLCCVATKIPLQKVQGIPVQPLAPLSPSCILIGAPPVVEAVVQVLSPHLKQIWELPMNSLR